MIHFPHLSGKRVLLVSHLLSQSGAPLLLVETASALAKSGARVALTNLGFHERLFRIPSVEGLRVIPVNQSFREAQNSDLIVANTAATREWVDELLALHPDSDSKLIWWIHEMETEYYGKGMNNLHLAGAVIFDSHASCRLWRQTGLRMPVAARVIHPCVTDDFLRDAGELRAPLAGSRQPGQPFEVVASRETIRQRLRLNEGDFLVSLFGDYCSRKGHDLLIKTIGRMLDANPALPLKVLLIGFRRGLTRQKFLNGLSEAECLALSKHRALRAVSDLRPFYLASDAFVMNTQDQGETFGRVTIEAMAFRLPVLGSDRGGTPEIVIDGVTGLLHPVGNYGEPILAGNIRYLVNDRRRAAALGEAGFQRILSHFTEARFYAELAEFIDTVLQKSGLNVSNSPSF